MDVEEWLAGLKLGAYAPLFRRQAIDAEILPSLTDADLEKLGLPLGHRKRLLAAIADLTAAPPAFRAAPQPERRQLSVMFVDLVGSTSLSARLDPEDMRAALGAYQNTVAGEIVRLEGHVAKFMGDGVLAYFGWPRAHENEADRAVTAGIAVTEAIGQLRSPDGRPLSARVGIATGLVVVGDLIGSGGAQEEAVVGETPNLAARLQTLAGSGEVVIAELTRNLIGGLFEVVDLGPRELHGFADPVRAWRVIGPGAAESRFEALHADSIGTLVGRERELALLVDRWQHAERGEGQAVFLVGEAGIGKSRLVTELRRRVVGEGHALAYYTSPYHTNTALWPFIDELARAARFERRDGPRERLTKIEALAAESCDEPARAAAVMSVLLGIRTKGRDAPPDPNPQHLKRQAFELLLRRLEVLTRSRPLLAIFEDAHWLDPTSTELLGIVIERMQRHQALVIMTSRPDVSLPASSLSHVTTLSLGRLDQHASGALVDRAAGNRPLPEAVKREILAKTEGIPLFLEELTKTVVESGSAQSSRMTSSAALGANVIPASLQDSLMTRLDHLDVAKELAQIGAVIGRAFSRELLAAVAPEVRDLDENLIRLVRSGLVFQRGTPPEVTYVFKHALVQDAAYASLLKSRRGMLHGRIATVLEEQFPDQVRSQPELLARHLTAAGLADRAIDFWTEAGRVASTRSANQEAIGHLTTALEILRHRPRDAEQMRRELNAQIALGPPLIATKGFAAPEVGSVYARAERLAKRLGSPSQYADALRGLCFFHHVHGDMRRVSALAMRLVDLTDASNDIVRQADAHQALAFTLTHRGKHEPASTHLAISQVRIERAGGPARVFSQGQNLQVFGLCYSSHIDWHLGFPDRSLQSAQEARDLAREVSHPLSVAVAHAYSALLHHFRREPEKVSAQARIVHAVSAEHGFSYYLAWSMIMHGGAIAETGSVSECISLVRTGIESLRKTGAQLRLPYYLWILADLYRRSQQAESAARTLAEAWAMAEQNGELWSNANLHQLEGELAVEAGDAKIAEMHFWRAFKVASQQGSRSLALRAGIRLGQFLAHAGREREVVKKLAVLCQSFGEGNETPDRREAAVFLGARRIEKGVELP